MNRSTFLLALAVLLAVISTRWVRLNVSASAPLGLYWVSAVPVEIPRGTFVILPVPQSIRQLWWGPLLKPVAGITGDTVCRQEDRLMINGLDYGPVHLDAHGRPVPHLETGCQMVPLGQVFLASHAPASLDSRYFGTVPVDRLTAAATPLLTWR